MKRTERCETCVFRMTRWEDYRCNYLALTGRTRLAVPPEDCTHYIQGDRLETREQTARFLQELEEKQQKKPDKRQKYDWGRAAELYRAGANDAEIAKALGASATAVYQWRRRMKLPANTQAGGLHGKRAEGHGTERNGRDSKGGNEVHEKRDTGPHPEDAAGGCGVQEKRTGPRTDPGRRGETGAGAIQGGPAGPGGL